MKKLFFLLFTAFSLISNAQWSNFISPWAGPSLYFICNDSLGNLYCSGYFTNNNSNYYVNKWDKSTNTWAELGGSNSLKANNEIMTMTLDTAGNLYAAGYFKNTSGNLYVAKWNKTTNTWSELGGQNSLIAYGSINCICIDPFGNIFVAGFISNASGYLHIAKWSKATNTWSELGGVNSFNRNGEIFSICSDTIGNIYAAGNLQNSSNYYYVAKCSKATNTWSELGGINSLSANSNINALLFDPTTGNIYVAGNFKNNIGNVFVAKWDGNNWSTVGGLNNSSFYGAIKNLCRDNSGNIYISGYLRNSNGYNYVGKWEKTTNTWSELGGANSLAANDDITIMHVDVFNNVYATGYFTNSNGNYYLAKYSSNTLPLSLLSFSIHNQELLWKTANEQNTSHFLVERSGNRKDFVNIGKVDAVCNNLGEKDYSFADNNPLQGVGYYRLKMVDKDGKFSYSKILSIKQQNTSSAQIYPNPVVLSATVTLQMQQAENVQVKIVSSEGKVFSIKAYKLTKGNNVITLNTSALAKGVYAVLIVGENTYERLAFVKE